MAERTIWSDDFDYATTAALEAAYQHSASMGTGTNVFTVDPITPGPTGYATGCTSQHVADVALAGNFAADSPILNPPRGRYFHVRGVWVFTYTDDFNASATLLTFAQNTLGFLSAYWRVNLRKSDNAIQLVVNGTTYPTPAYTSAYTTAVTPGSANRIDVYGYLSTLSDAGGGVYAPNLDGSITLTVNDVQVFTHSGKVWNFEDTLSAPSWNYVKVAPAGTFSGLRIMDDDGITASAGLGQPGYPAWQ